MQISLKYMAILLIISFVSPKIQVSYAMEDFTRHSPEIIMDQSDKEELEKIIILYEKICDEYKDHINDIIRQRMKILNGYKEKYKSNDTEINKIDLEKARRFLSEIEEQYVQTQPKWNSIYEYLNSRLERNLPTKLVVGCGHCRLNEIQSRIGGDPHGLDIRSGNKNDQYTHSDAWTINESDNLKPDQMGDFKKMKIKDIFDEVFIENVPTKDRKELYNRAFKLLKPGGKLIDDRYFNNWGENKEEDIHRIQGEVAEMLKDCFEEIEFKDNVKNDANEREGQYILYAVKSLNPKEKKNCGLQ